MFNYKIIDNFLNKDDFTQLSSLNLKEIEKDQIKIFHNKIFKNGNVQGECLDADFIKILFKNYHITAMDLLKIFSPEKTKLWEYSEFHIVQTGSDYKYPVHRDSPFKLLSGVIYLKPELSKGTLLYEKKNGKNAKEISWKQNRGFFFSRSENNSYHSYEGDGKSTRVALVYNLMTTKLKEVCEIENISYYKVRTREFVNPYLYRFFKILF
jgi:hypothetical protein